jgi:hypothetical protein
MTIDASSTWVPDACTLPTVEQPLRLAAFDELFGAAVTSVRRVDPTRVELALAYEPAVAGRAAELATRETGCCSFFEFVLSISDGVLVMQVRTPPAYADVLDALVRRAEAALGQHAGRSLR